MWKKKGLFYFGNILKTDIILSLKTLLVGNITLVAEKLAEVDLPM